MHNKKGVFLAHEFVIFRLSPQGKIIKRYNISSDKFMVSFPRIIPIINSLKGFYILGEFYKYNDRKRKIYSILKLNNNFTIDRSFKPIIGMNYINEKISAGENSITSDGALIYFVKYGYYHKKRKGGGVHFDIRKVSIRGVSDKRFNKNIRPYVKDAFAFHSFSVNKKDKLIISIRTENIYRDGVNRLLLFNAYGKRVRSFKFNEISFRTKFSGGVDVKFTHIISLNDDGYAFI